MVREVSWPWQPCIYTALAALIGFSYSLYILAYPPVHKKLSMVLLALPMSYAFIHHLDLVSSYQLADTFGRTVYIFYAHMSYEVVILEFAPKIEKENDGWRSRVRQAYSVLWDRNHAQITEDQAHSDQARKDLATNAESELAHEKDVQDEPRQPVTITTTKKQSHGLSRLQFTAYRIVQAFLLYLALAAWIAYETHYSVARDLPFDFNPIQGSFFRRLPDSLHPFELCLRLEHTFDWTIISMFQYEFYHAIVAIFFVGILQTDRPEDWSLSLCGHVSEAWSVRRYWGKHWHNFIYHSFSAHAKILTRGWLGFKRGRLSTRLLENAIVFGISGLGHSAVRRAQDRDGDIWSISLWYVGQMLPIMMEGVVQHLWRNARVKMGIKMTNKFVNALEKAFGYAWVVAWFAWSVPKYIYTRNAWTEVNIRRKYAAEWTEMELNAGNMTD